MSACDFRPVTAGDIARCQRSWNMRATDLGWLLGMSVAHWGRLMRDAKEQPDRIAEPGHALLLRWLSRHRHQTVSLVETPCPASLYRKLCRALPGGLTMRWFALALGAEQSAGQRWVTLGRNAGPATRRALAILHAGSSDAIPKLWEEWCEIARLEANLRGLGDLERRASWYRTKQEAACAS